jgi:NAD(P)H-hydrate repair Nnr-like enzyme with NAD(P)H-hydrate epimerase domain
MKRIAMLMALSLAVLVLGASSPFGTNRGHTAVACGGGDDGGDGGSGGGGE